MAAVHLVYVFQAPCDDHDDDENEGSDGVAEKGPATIDKDKKPKNNAINYYLQKQMNAKLDPPPSCYF